jgi:hypothetical protein
MQRASCLFLFFVLFAQAAWGFRTRACRQRTHPTAHMQYARTRMLTVVLGGTELAPLHVAADPSQRVEGEYLVLLREGLSRPLCTHHHHLPSRAVR